MNLLMYMVQLDNFEYLILYSTYAYSHELILIIIHNKYYRINIVIDIDEL